MAIGEMRECAREGCDAPPFQAKTHNQIFHSAECTRIATNEKIMRKYYANRARKLGLARYCEVCNETRLSRYNPDDICNACSQKEEESRRSAVIDMLDSIVVLAN